MLSTDIPQKPRIEPGITAQRSQLRWTRWMRHIRFHVFSSPWWLLGFLGLTVFPLGYALWLSFTNYDGYTDPRWVGLRNYTEAFQDSLVWLGLQRTFLYMLIVVPLGVIGALILALMLNRPLRGVGILRTLFYLPSVVPIVGAAIAFKLLFSRDQGAVNAILELMHIAPVSWLNTDQAFMVMILLVTWGIGGGMIVTLAGLQTVPVELLEASAIDGASAWTRFWKVTLPLLSPIIFFQVITGVIGSLQVMIQPFLLAPITDTSNVNTTTIPEVNQVYMYHVYTEIFGQGRFGYGSALIWLLFLAILLLTLLIFFGARKYIYYEAVDNR
jgi:multiple sugar transport system permease protein